MTTRRKAKPRQLLLLLNLNLLNVNTSHPSAAECGPQQAKSTSDTVVEQFAFSSVHSSTKQVCRAAQQLQRVIIGIAKHGQFSRPCTLDTETIVEYGVEPPICVRPTNWVVRGSEFTICGSSTSGNLWITIHDYSHLFGDSIAILSSRIHTLSPVASCSWSLVGHCHSHLHSPSVLLMFTNVPSVRNSIFVSDESSSCWRWPRLEGFTRSGWKERMGWEEFSFRDSQ